MIQTRSRFVWLLLASSCGLLTGCLGGTYNPSYFPFYLPPGDIIQTHAKPAGRGYFANFDPKAVKLEVTPTQVSNPTKTQQVLVATISDADGQPRRKRRVEWILDGPGFILEVDEGGIAPGRGYLDGTKKAISYTDYREHLFNRGTENPRDDFTIYPGQTWCIVSCAVPGETTVTAYAPEIYDHERRTITTRLTWTDSQTNFTSSAAESTPRMTGPPSTTTSRNPTRENDRPAPIDRKSVAGLTLDVQAPKAAAFDRPTAFTLELANNGTASSQPVTVRTTVPEDADFVSADPPPTVQQDRQLTWTAGTLTGNSKRTIILNIRSFRKGPLTLSATAETPDGLHADNRATVNIGTPMLKLTAEAPEVSAIGERIPLALLAENPSAIADENVTAWLTLPEGTTHPSGTNPVEVPLGSIVAGQTKRVEVPLTAKQPGRFNIVVNATGDAGLKARTTATLDVRRAALSVGITGPSQVMVNDEATWQIQVTNTGDGAIPESVLRVNVPEEMRVLTASDDGVASNKGVVEWRLGLLAPGQKRTVKLTATSEKVLEKATLNATITAGKPGATSAVQAQMGMPIAINGQPVLTLNMTEVPKSVTVGLKSSLRIVVKNTGTGPATKVDVAFVVEGLKLASGTGADRQPAQVNGLRLTFGTLDKLPAGATAVFLVEFEGTGIGTARVQVLVTSEGDTKALREEQALRVVSGN